MSVLSPQVSVTSPDGANLPASSSRRRGLSYLRELAQARLGGGHSTESPRSPARPHTSRATSYTDSRNLTTSSGRRRSVSRPNEITRVVSTLTAQTEENQWRRSLSPTAANRRTRSLSRERSEEANRQSNDSTSSDMARQRHNSKRTHSGHEHRHSGVNGTSTNEDDSRRTRERPSEPMAEPAEGTEKAKLPTIRFLPHQEIRNGKQSLHFNPVSRTMPDDSCIIRVGRYSEREGIPITNPTMPSDAPVGFKSKVVSRKHCEFSFANGQWHVKDVASSSGTFLNHIRLSQPNAESRLFPVKDGDILQLGIDFRGGEEMIFRCVKIRIECNRSWQKRPNNFNKSRFAQLQSLSKDDSANANTGECAICLNAIGPTQALFVAPCAHVWHYKCVRPILEGKNNSFPSFNCPNCRAYSDLSADVDVEPEDFDEEMEDADQTPPEEKDEAAAVPAPASNTVSTYNDNADINSNTAPRSRTPDVATETSSRPEVARRSSISSSGLLSRRQATNPASPELNSVNGLEMPQQRFDADETTNELEPEITRTESPDPANIISGEGPLTPRNNAGPFVFDGSAGRPSSNRRLIVSAISEDADSID